MKKYFNLIATIVIFFLVSMSSVLAQDTLLYDEFDTLNPTVWNAGGTGSVTVVNSVVEIDSGGANGGGHTIDVIDRTFPIDANTILTLESRVRISNENGTSDPNGGLMMFWNQQLNQWQAVGFRTVEFDSTAKLNATSRMDFSFNPVKITEIEVPHNEPPLNLDITEWHTYQVRYSLDVVNYYIDGVLVATITTNIPQISNIGLRFSGENRGGRRTTLFVDWVKVTSSPINNAPDCSSAYASEDSLWPPQHNLVNVEILGITDPDGDVLSITVDSVFQDEPTNGLGDGDTSPDASGIGTGIVMVRSERSGTGNGRVYHVNFTANDGMSGSCTGTVNIRVDKNQGKNGQAIDDGSNYDSTQP